MTNKSRNIDLLLVQAQRDHRISRFDLLEHLVRDLMGYPCDVHVVLKTEIRFHHGNMQKWVVNQEERSVDLAKLK